MAFRYSGGALINRTYTPATKQDHVNNISQALLDAGWTTISGTPGSSADVVQESATNNVGAKIRHRIRDALSATISAECTLKHPLGSTGDSSACYLAVSNTWRVLATPRTYCAFMTTAANNAQARCAVMAGTLYLPSFIVIASGDACGFLWGAGNSDSDANSRTGWRRQCRVVTSFPWVFTTIMGGALALHSQGGGVNNWQGGAFNTDQAYRWEDNTALAYEALLSGTNSGEDKIFGQIYDMAVVNGFYTGETSFSLDGHTWMFITEIPSAVAVSSTAALAVVLT